MILWDSIYNKLINLGVSSRDIDVRYLQKWIRLYPEIFPKFMFKKYTIYFNNERLRWEIYK